MNRDSGILLPVVLTLMSLAAYGLTIPGGLVEEKEADSQIAGVDASLLPRCLAGNTTKNQHPAPLMQSSIYSSVQPSSMNRAIVTTMSDFLKEVRLSNDLSKNFDLDNNDNFSPDGKWLVYDIRTESGGIGGCNAIERIHTESGKTELLYQLPQNDWYGPGVGAASYHPHKERVIFIHGVMNASPENPYQQWRRTGVMVDTDRPGEAIFMDSRDVTMPFTPGALRGGTHRHEWSRDGKWIGYTYNDAILQSLEAETGARLNLRTIAVSGPGVSPQIAMDRNGENVQGEWPSAVVVKVVPRPKPGSDEIVHAASDSWVGTSGYLKRDGTLQVARAFLGRVITEEGQPVDELFIVDIPENIQIPGEEGPLEGTIDAMPMPPAGTRQRRITYTAFSAYPGCFEVVRSSPDGTRISFVARDNQGIRQLFLIAPEGGDPEQLTYHSSDVQSGARWSSSGHHVIYVCDNSIMLCELSDRPFYDRVRRLTEYTEDIPSNLVWSADGALIAYNRDVKSETGSSRQIFLLRLNSN